MLGVSVLLIGLGAALPAQAEGNDLGPRQSEIRATEAPPQFRLCLPYLPYIVDISRLWHSGLPEHRYLAALSLLAVSIRTLTCR
jgi:hypothetical protein